MTMRSGYGGGAGVAGTALVGRGGLVQMGDGARRTVLKSTPELANPAIRLSWMRFPLASMAVRGRRDGG